MEHFFEVIKHFLLPLGIGVSGSLAKFLLGSQTPKKIKDWLTLVVFALFLMVIIKFTMNVVAAVVPNQAALLDALTNLLYALSSLTSREILLKLVEHMPDKIADKILATIDVDPRR